MSPPGRPKGERRSAQQEGCLRNILTLNVGSSSIKFPLYQRDPALRRLWRGQIDRIGCADAAIDVQGSDTTTGNGQGSVRHRIADGTFDTAAVALLAWLEMQPEFGSIAGVGHRVVYGMQHSEPEPVGDELLNELPRAHLRSALAFLGIELDAQRNAVHAPLISADSSRVHVRVMQTDEDLMIARAVSRELANAGVTASGPGHEP